MVSSYLILYPSELCHSQWILEQNSISKVKNLTELIYNKSMY